VCAVGNNEFVVTT